MTDPGMFLWPLCEERSIYQEVFPSAPWWQELESIPWAEHKFTLKANSIDGAAGQCTEYPAKTG